MSVGDPPAVWRGISWRALKPKSPVNAAVLSCTSARFCMAVGGSNGELDSWRWNGHGWRKLTTPQVGCVPNCGLSGVTCVSARNCLAVGFSCATADSCVAFGRYEWPTLGRARPAIAC
jgi:hypothetical protein